MSLQPPNGGPLVECFSIPVNLDNGGYLMVSGRSGQNEPDAHKLKMIRVMDPMVKDLNQHVEDAHELKVDKF